MSRNQRIYCHDILDRIRRIENYSAAGRAAFMQSELLQDGVIRSFEVIGEAVKRLDPDLTADYPQVTWSDFAGFRDVLIHQYHHIRPDLVWDFVQEDLPALKAAVTALLHNLTDSEDAGKA